MARRAAKFTNLPICQIYHGPKSGKIYQFTDLKNLPWPEERRNLPIYRFTKFTMARRAAKFTNLPIWKIYHCPESGEIYQFTDLPNLPLPGERRNLPIYRFTKFTIARRAAKFTNLPIYQIYHCPESVLSLASCLTQWRLRAHDFQWFSAIPSKKAMFQVTLWASYPIIDPTLPRSNCNQWNMDGFTSCPPQWCYWS